MAGDTATLLGIPGQLPEAEIHGLSYIAGNGQYPFWCCHRMQHEVYCF